MINGDAYDGRGLDMTHISCNMFSKDMWYRRDRFDDHNIFRLYEKSFGWC